MKTRLLNIFVDNLTMDEALTEINRLIQEKKQSYVVTPNLDHIVVVEKDLEFQEIYDNASLVLTDGKPLLWIARYLGTPIKEKLSGSDIFPHICELAAQKEYRLFILGGAEGVADKAANNLVNRFPTLQVVGTYSPPVGFENNQKELKRIIQMINNAKTDILAVALGSPKGEKFIYRIREKIDASLSISIGATIDFEAGTIKRSPKWMSDAGLEWFHRLIHDPKRLTKRYLRDAFFIFPIIKKYTFIKKRRT